MAKNGTHSEDNTLILPCPTCPPHEFQDARYGRGQRVANRLQQGSAQLDKYRCTACGKTIPRR